MAKTALVLTFLAGIVLAFHPNVRVDHENRQSHACFHASIALGPSGPGCQPVYVALQDDSMVGMVSVRSDVLFQKSTDQGATWLAEDRLIRRGADFACYPDITAGQDGTLYIVYTERVPGGSLGHFYCVSSTDGGETWSSPAQVDDNASPVSAGWARVAADTLGSLFCAWNDKRTGRQRIWSSVSTDRGATWSADVRVDDDTVPGDCFHPDVFVDPGTNNYLAVSSNPYWVRPGYISSHAMFTMSTDMGETFSPCVELDTFTSYTGQPHVVADREYVVCDYTGNSGGNQQHTQARTSTDGGETWGSQVPVTELDTLYTSYYNGAKLAMDGSGGVHTALMLAALANYDYNICYSKSTDHGVTWSDRETVNDVTSGDQSDSDIAADINGYAYVVWQDQRNSRNEIWFGTNANVGILGRGFARTDMVRMDGTPSLFSDALTIRLLGPLPAATNLRVFDATGSMVCEFENPGPILSWNGKDGLGRQCPPGAYIIRLEYSGQTVASEKVLRVE
jgi:hypothetical protein